MPKKQIELIGAGLGWGAKYHEAGLGPQALKEFQLSTELQKKSQSVDWRCILSPEIPFSADKKLNYDQRLQQVLDFDKRLAKELSEVLQQDHFPVVLGGDHSIAVGTWSGVTTALKAQSSFGLIWLDAHMDSHTPETTPSQAIHGMPLAALMGYGESGLVDLCAKGAKLNPKHVVLIGVRSFEEGEQALLQKLKVKIYYMDEVKKRGFNTVFAEALTIATNKTQGFGLSIDLDAFDPEFTPGTGTPVPGGLEVENVTSALSIIKDHPLLKALEIAEFDTTRDKDEKTAQVVQALISNIL